MEYVLGGFEFGGDPIRHCLLLYVSAAAVFERKENQRLRRHRKRLQSQNWRMVSGTRRFEGVMRLDKRRIDVDFL